MTPAVSIIIPTYNRASLVREAALSVLAQTFEDFELIIVDDGSTDGTADALAGLDDRLRYVPQANAGRSAARNRGLELAAGEFVAFLDSDDLFLPTKLERQVGHMRRPGAAAMSYTSAVNTDAEGNRYPFDYEASARGDIYSRVAMYIPVTVCLPTVMVRRSVLDEIGGFDERLDRFEDTDMWRRIAKRHRVDAIREPLTAVRFHDGNQMERTETLLAAIDTYVEKVLAEDADVGRDRLHAMAARLYYHYAMAVRRERPGTSDDGAFLARALRYAGDGPLRVPRLHAAHTFRRVLRAISNRLPRRGGTLAIPTVGGRNTAPPRVAES